GQVNVDDRKVELRGPLRDFQACRSVGSLQNSPAGLTQDAGLGTKSGRAIVDDKDATDVLRLHPIAPADSGSRAKQARACAGTTSVFRARARGITRKLNLTFAFRTTTIPGAVAPKS